MAIIYFELPLYWFFICYVITALFGSHDLLFVGCYAYIADTVKTEKRGFRITVVDSLALFLSVTANLGIGYWIRASGFLLPYFFVFGTQIIAMVYALCFIPETVKKNPSAKLKPADVLNMFLILFKDTEKKRRWKIHILLFSFCIDLTFYSGALLTLFQMNAPLCWGPVLIAYFAFVNGSVQAVMTVAGRFLFWCISCFIVPGCWVHGQY